MMRTGGAGRFWVAGGVFGAVVLLATAWFLLISPQYTQAGSLGDQADATRGRLVTLRHRLTELRQQNGNLAQYQAQLALDRQALPTASGMSEFLRELQAAGDASGVAVTGLIVGSPIQVTAGGSQVFALQLTLTAAGTPAKLNVFLDQLQQVQPRAVLISSANEVAEGTGGSFTVTVGLQVFVAPPGATTGKPQPSASPS